MWLVLLGCTGKPTVPGPPIPIDLEPAFFRSGLTMGGEFVAGYLEYSGASEGRIEELDRPFLIHGFAGPDCTASLVVYEHLWSFRSSLPVDWVPLSFDYATLGADDLQFKEIGPTHHITWRGGRYELLEQQAETAWVVDVTVPEVCRALADPILQEPICEPQVASIHLEIDVDRPGDAQIEADEALRFFDAVPAENWTFEGAPLPPCVPRRLE